MNPADEWSRGEGITGRFTVGFGVGYSFGGDVPGGESACILHILGRDLRPPKPSAVTLVRGSPTPPLMQVLAWRSRLEEGLPLDCTYSAR